MEYDPFPESEKSTARAPRAQARRRRLPGGRRLWIFGLLPLGVVLIGACAGVAVGAAIHMPRVEAVAEYTPSLITRVYDRSGDLFATFARERRVLIPEDEIPKLLTQAIVAAEDRSFFEHSGIDAVGVVRAAIENLQAGRITQGASTLTMQLAENLFHTRGRDWSRKIAEALLAVEIEKRYTKRQILAMYMNQVYLGHGNYGMQAAAQYYFGRDAADLTLPQAATLAGLVQRPSDYSPYDAPQLVLERREYVLRAMNEVGFIDDAELQRALEAPLAVVPHRASQNQAAYFAEEVRQWIENRFGTEALLERGLRVQTTLDHPIQIAARDALRDGLLRIDHRRGWDGPIRHLGEDELALSSPPESEELEPGSWHQGVVLQVAPRQARVRVAGQILTLTPASIEWTGRRRIDSLLSRGDVAWFQIESTQDGDLTPVLQQEPEIEGAVIVLESATGAIRAMVGGWNFERSRFNRATQAHRQVGSAFKPFVYGAALESGFTPADTILDAPVSFRGATKEQRYYPQNYYRRFNGIVTLRHGLEDSINVAAVKLLDLVGVQRIIDFARRSGIDSALPPYPSLALGSADLTPLEMAAGYATFSNRGLYVTPWMIARVTAHSDEVLMQHRPDIHQATKPAIAYVLTHMLEGVVDRGTAQSMRGLPLDLAGKTGTTDNFTDAWFVGFTPKYTIATWIGYDTKRSLGHGMTGSQAALPIWGDIIQRGLEEGWIREDARFDPPAGVEMVAIDYNSGLLPGPGSGQIIREAFVAGTAPTRHTTAQWEVILGLPWYQQLAFYLPKEGERMPDSYQRPARQAALVAE